MIRLTTNKKLDPEIFKNMKDMPENKYFLKVPEGKTFDGTIELVADKLGRQEDIEEELGIDLITLFKALKNGIYVDPYYIDFATTDNFLCPDNLDYFDINRKQIVNGIYFKDYGVTWALTKEELENEL